MLRHAALLFHLCAAADPYYERGLAAARAADLARAKAIYRGRGASALQAPLYT